MGLQIYVNFLFFSYNKKQNLDFIEILTRWYSENKRELPWRKTQDPYTIWICEIIFQQTRINQGLSYYNRFIEKFPDVETLAKATEDEVLKYWEGLGYYSRARNLHFSAQYIVNELNSKFPTHYSSLKELKGVGDYTASAIASICYQEKVPAIDGNALRVYARLFNSFLNIADPSTAKVFKEKIQPFLPENIGDFNQAIMELGALICSPKNPNCEECPLVEKCGAYQNGNQTILPIKEKKIKISDETLSYIIAFDNEGFFIHQRKGKGIWKGLFELLPEDSVDTNIQKVETLKHKLTHKNLRLLFYQKKLKPKEKSLLQKVANLIWVPWGEEEQFAFPKPIKDFIFTFVKNNKFEKNL